jgi:hypothetical protein
VKIALNSADAAIHPSDRSHREATTSSRVVNHPIHSQLFRLSNLHNKKELKFFFDFLRDSFHLGSSSAATVQANG